MCVQEKISLNYNYNNVIKNKYIDEIEDKNKDRCNM